MFVRANRFRELSVVERRRIGSAFYDFLVHNGIYKIGGNTRLDVFCGNVKNLSSQLDVDYQSFRRDRNFFYELTRQTTRIFSCSSLFNIRGG